MTTALAAVSRVGFKDHLLATVIGKLPSAWIEVTIGHDLFSFFRAHLLRLTLLTLASGLIYLVFIRNNRDSL